MFGNNKIIKQDLNSDVLYVKKIFKTIQGEGPFAGVPAIFIRMAGCNLQCKFCDTDFERDACYTLDRVMAHLLDQLGSSNISLVVITGGEPLLQNILPLVEALIIAGFKVQIETAGTVWIDGLENLLFSDALNSDSLTATDAAVVVVSPKTKKLHAKVYLYAWHWKYIHKAGCSDLTDGLPDYNAVTGEVGYTVARPLRKTDIVYLQPCDDDYKDDNTKDAIIICIEQGYRFSLQQHKIIGVE